MRRVYHLQRLRNAGRVSKNGRRLARYRPPNRFSLCQYGVGGVWKWGPDAGGNLWRTGGDISDSWDSISRIGFNQIQLVRYLRPGHWNDPAMLEIGNGHMTDSEYRTPMTLWSMLAAPLIAGNDARNMSASIRDILTNREVIAIDQDKAAQAPKRVWLSGRQEVWSRELAVGDVALAVFHRAPGRSRFDGKTPESPRLLRASAMCGATPNRTGPGRSIPRKSPATASFFCA